MPRSDSASAAPRITASRMRVVTARGLWEATFTPPAFDDALPGDPSELHELPSSQSSTARQPGQSSTLQTPATSPKGEPGSDLSLEDVARISLSEWHRSSNEAPNSRYAHSDSDNHSFTSSESEPPTITLGKSALGATRASFDYGQIFEKLRRFREDGPQTTANNAATTPHKGYAQQYQQRRAQTTSMQHHETPSRALDHVKLDLAATPRPLSIPTETAHRTSRTQALATTTQTTKISQTRATFHTNQADIDRLKARYEREVIADTTRMSNHLTCQLDSSDRARPFIAQFKAQKDKTLTMIRQPLANIQKLQQTMQDFYQFRDTVLASKRPAASSNVRP